jgi:hypothetical protein
MFGKDYGKIAWISALILLVFCLYLIPSCKKSTPKSPSESSGQQASGTGETKKPATVEQASAVEKPGAELVQINIALPKPMFVGTPQPTMVANLEKPLGKPRPPFLAPMGTKNVALRKPITASDEEPIIGEIEYITDGDKEAADGSYVELGPFQQHIVIDLQAEHEIYAIVIWHFHKQATVYFDVVVQVADDPDFITNVKTVFNNDVDNSAGLGVGKDMHYVETNEGKLIDCLSQGPVRGRYVRLYSNGNTENDLNHYIEVEVYGKAVE